MSKECKCCKGGLDSLSKESLVSLNRLTEDRCSVYKRLIKDIKHRSLEIECSTEENKYIKFWEYVTLILKGYGGN